MIEPLSAYLRKYLHDAVSLQRALKGPVLLIEPKVDEDEEGGDEEYRFRTQSGVGTSPMEAGEPLVLVVRKQAANAFQKRITLGRTSNNDLVLDDASVSRFHAWFEQDDERGWMLADAGSKNGTQLNGQKLSAKKMVAVPKDARLRFGDVPASFLTPQSFIGLLKKQVGGK